MDETRIKIVSFAATKKRWGSAPNLKDWSGRPYAATWDERARCYRIHTTYKGQPVVLHLDPEDAERY
ncbi:MAG TPA: hypothetical protein VKA48_07730 [Gammaproteobacteria bacterium]|nr:hypothetical protein [Gammaproteobacteria bacterium]